VDDPHDLLDVRVEQAERVRVGQHEARGLRVRLCAQVVEVDAAVGVRADLDNLVTAIVTVAGFVPCAVSGVSTVRRCSPRSA